MKQKMDLDQKQGQRSAVPDLKAPVPVKGVDGRLGSHEGAPAGMDRPVNRKPPASQGEPGQKRDWTESVRWDWLLGANINHTHLDPGEKLLEVVGAPWRIVESYLQSMERAVHGDGTIPWGMASGAARAVNSVREFVRSKKLWDMAKEERSADGGKGRKKHVPDSRPESFMHNGRSFHVNPEAARLWQEAATRSLSADESRLLNQVIAGVGMKRIVEEGLTGLNPMEAGFFDPHDREGWLSKMVGQMPESERTEFMGQMRAAAVRLASDGILVEDADGRYRFGWADAEKVRRKFGGEDLAARLADGTPEADAISMVLSTDWLRGVLNEGTLDEWRKASPAAAALLDEACRVRDGHGLRYDMVAKKAQEMMGAGLLERAKGGGFSLVVDAPKREAGDCREVGEKGPEVGVPAETPVVSSDLDKRGLETVQMDGMALGRKYANLIGARLAGDVAAVEKAGPGVLVEMREQLSAACRKRPDRAEDVASWERSIVAAWKAGLHLGGELSPVEAQQFRANVASLVGTLLEPYEVTLDVFRRSAMSSLGAYPVVGEGLRPLLQAQLGIEARDQYVRLASDGLRKGDPKRIPEHVIGSWVAELNKSMRIVNEPSSLVAGIENVIAAIDSTVGLGEQEKERRIMAIFNQIEGHQHQMAVLTEDARKWLGLLFYDAGITRVEQITPQMVAGILTGGPDRLGAVEARPGQAAAWRGGLEELLAEVRGHYGQAKRRLGVQSDHMEI